MNKLLGNGVHDEMYYSLNNSYAYDELYHHGIRGQKWGIRRFQDESGSLTAAGKKRYGIGDVVLASSKRLSNLKKKRDATKDAINKSNEQRNSEYKRIASSRNSSTAARVAAKSGIALNNAKTWNQANKDANKAAGKALLGAVGLKGASIATSLVGGAVVTKYAMSGSPRTTSALYTGVKLASFTLSAAATVTAISAGKKYVDGSMKTMDNFSEQQSKSKKG